MYGVGQLLTIDQMLNEVMWALASSASDRKLVMGRLRETVGEEDPLSVVCTIGLRGTLPRHYSGPTCSTEPVRTAALRLIQVMLEARLHQ